MKRVMFLKAVLFAVLVNYTASAQKDVFKSAGDSIPVLQEWWHSDLEAVNPGFLLGGISFLPNFKNKLGAIAITRAERDETWMLKFPGDTLNVFTWQKNGARKIQTGDFNGDGITDYLDAMGNIYLGLENGQPPSTNFLHYSIASTNLPRRIVADFNNDGFEDILISGFIDGSLEGWPNLVQILLGTQDISKLQLIKKEKITPSKYYDESVIGVYQSLDSSWRIVCYWDDYSTNPASTRGNGGFVIYKMKVVSDGNSERIDIKELDRTSKLSNSSDPLYYHYSDGLTQIYKSSHSNNAYLIATTSDFKSQSVFSLQQDSILPYEFSTRIGGIIPSIDGDEHEDIVTVDLIYSGGDTISQIPILKYKRFGGCSTASAMTGDINGDNFNDIIFFHFGGCLSILLGQSPTSISEFSQLNFSLKTFKTTSTHFTISFTLVKESPITLSLFDLEGKLVKVLKEEMLGSGEQSFVWDSGSMPQGAYVLQFIADGKTATEKILITR